MEFNNWKIDPIAAISGEEFYNLVQSNKDHIRKTFPVTLSGCESLEKTSFFLENAIEKEKNKTGYHFYIRNLETNFLIGYVCIKNINPAISKCELAYFVDKNFQGKGIISKAVSQIIAFCFNELSMNKIFICTSKINFGSQKIAINQGFIKEGILREEFKNGEGILEDIIYFGLLKSNYSNEK